MYPPRRSNDSLTKNKSPNSQTQYTSPLHKDANKVNKILQNAKRYEQIKQQKRDYMMQGIMNLQRKPSQQQQNSRKKRQSQLSNRSSDGGEDQRKDIYRKAQPSDYRYEQTTRLDHQRVPSQNKDKGNLNQYSKQMLTGNYKSIDNLNNLQAQGYKNLNQGILSGIPNTYNTKYQVKTDQNNFQQPSINNQYVYKTRQPQNQSQILQSNNIISSTLNNQAKQQNIAHTPQYIASQNFQQKYATNNTYNKVDEKSQNNLTANSPPSNFNSNNNYNQLNRVTSQPQLGNKRQQNLANNNYSKPNLSQTNNITNSITTNQITNNPPNTTSNPQNNSITKTSPANSSTQQKLINNSLQHYNNTKTEEQKKQIVLKNFNEQQYLKKLETGQKYNDQNKFIKTQMDKLITQANQMRNKFYKAEEERIVLIEKCRVFEQQNNKVRAQNEQLKLKYKNAQLQINTLQSYKQLAENQMKQLRNNKQSIYDDLMRKMNQLNIQLRKKSLQVTKYQRIISQLQNHTNQKNYEINRLKQFINRKQQQNLQLQQKQYQLNKLNSQNNKTDLQVKSYIDKITNLQKDIANLKDNKNNITRLQTQLSKYRKQMQEIVQDMKDLQMQLQAKDRIINEYKSYDHRNMEDNRAKMLEKQLQLVMKQKGQISKNYEHKLLEKDKRISQIQSQSYDSAIRTTKISGIQAGEAAFQDILKQQVQQINNLKRQNLQRTNQVFTTKIQLQNLRSQLQNQQSRIKILNLQIQSGAKNAQSVTQSHLRAARNQIESLNRRIQILNNIIESKRKQNLNKDQFIKKYLLGNNTAQDVSSLVGKLQRILNNKT